MSTYLENPIDTVASDITTIHTFLNRAAHTDGSEVIKVQTAGMSSGAMVMRGGHYGVTAVQ